MRPAPIPDGLVWEGATRIVIGPPDGDLTNPDVGSVEALVETVEDVPGVPAGCAAATLRLIPEPGDLEALAAGGALLLTVYGPLPMFTLTVVDQNHQATPSP